jgi:hypothetical protein
MHLRVPHGRPLPHEAVDAIEKRVFAPDSGGDLLLSCRELSIVGPEDVPMPPRTTALRDEHLQVQTPSPLRADHLEDRGTGQRILDVLGTLHF